MRGWWSASSSCTVARWRRSPAWWCSPRRICCRRKSTTGRRSVRECRTQDWSAPIPAKEAGRCSRSCGRDALVAIGAQRGAIRLAHALHRLPPDARRRRMDEIVLRDRLLGERIDRMMRNEELMSGDDNDQLSDEHPAVRASEEGVEWEVL